MELQRGLELVFMGCFSPLALDLFLGPKEKAFSCADKREKGISVPKEMDLVSSSFLAELNPPKSLEL